MFKKAVSKKFCKLKYCPYKYITQVMWWKYRYITQEMCEKVFQAYILAITLVPEWFIAPKMHAHINNVYDDDDDDYDVYDEEVDDHDEYKYYNNYDIAMFSKLSSWNKKYIQRKKHKDAIKNKSKI